jgi:hypothetical protein
MMREFIMSRYRFAVGLVVGLFFSTSLASAILFDTANGRVGGFVLKDDSTQLKINIVRPDGQEEVKDFLHSDIKILHQLDVKRLERLSPDYPKGYSDYADKLAEQQADPEARYYALHLYLLAAKLAPEELGASSLLRMSKLANRPAEARKYRAMAYLLDPKADPNILKPKAEKPAQSTPLQARALEEFTKALQLYRAGQIKLASETAKHEGVEAIFSMAPGNIDVKTFLQWCNDANCTTCRADGKVICPNCNGRGVVLNAFRQLERCPTCKGQKRAPCPDCGGTHVHDPLPDDTLRAVLRCELWAIDRQGAGDNPGQNATETKGWSAVLQSRRLNPVLPLSLETITSFDPSKCLYRNRKWVDK